MYEFQVPEIGFVRVCRFEVSGASGSGLQNVEA